MKTFRSIVKYYYLFEINFLILKLLKSLEIKELLKTIPVLRILNSEVFN